MVVVRPLPARAAGSRRQGPVRRCACRANQVLACASACSTAGLFRIGTEDYAVTNETMPWAIDEEAPRHHQQATTRSSSDYPASYSSATSPGRRPESRRSSGSSSRAAAASTSCCPTRDGRAWRDVKSGDINAYLKDATGSTCRPRTSAPGSDRARRRDAGRVELRRLLADQAQAPDHPRGQQVSHTTSATPAVARASYIDPRVFDRFRDGIVSSPSTWSPTRTRARPSTAGRGGGARPHHGGERALVRGLERAA